MNWFEEDIAPCEDSSSFVLAARSWLITKKSAVSRVYGGVVRVLE